MSFITDDVCEKVTLCGPNEIVQNCLPVYDELECRIAATEKVPEKYWFKYFNFEDGLAPDWWRSHETVDYTIEKAVRPGDPADNLNVVHKTGTAGIDWLSGYGLLEWISRDNGPAQAESSLYYNDPIHFFFNGGDGNDALEGANNSDQLWGENGDDWLSGLGGDDLLYGGEGNDEIYGGTGNDLLDGGAGNDTLKGGDGDDQLNGGDGNDWMSGGDGNDNLHGGQGDDWMSGGKGNDWMSGGGGNDKMYGGEGDDCMSGGGGDDEMCGDEGNDRMVGNAGNDTMYGGEGNDKMDGGNGDDYVHGDAGNDLVVGGKGNDHVYGGAGDDIVRGGFGDDIMTGGEGCDQFVFCEVDYDCKDTITDFSVTDRDQIDIKDMAIDSVRVVLTGHDDEIFLDLMSDGEEAGRVLVQSADGANLDRVFSVDTAFGTGQGALVQVGTGVMIDLPSESILYVEDGMFV
jgi:Ca2+-binding RTX toxin-like protein